MVLLLSTTFVNTLTKDSQTVLHVTYKYEYKNNLTENFSYSRNFHLCYLRKISETIVSDTWTIFHSLQM